MATKKSKGKTAKMPKMPKMPKGQEKKMMMPGMPQEGKKKLPKTYEGKSTKPGGGGRFAMMEDKLMARGMTKESAEKVAAAAGRKKYGPKKMAEMAAKGRKSKGK